MDDERQDDPACLPDAASPPRRLSPPLAAGPESPDRPEDAEMLALLARSRAPLRALFRVHGIGPEEADDLLQEALLIIVLGWRRVGDPLGYLLGTVKKRIQIYLRRLQGERAGLFELGQLAPAGAGDVPQLQVDFREDARRLLARLPEGSRRIVEMRYGEDLSSCDIAQALDRSDTSVRQAASRGLRRLRRYAEAVRSSC
jgi:RNA polymerase sigma factor (sigma-70 family)